MGINSIPPKQIGGQLKNGGPIVNTNFKSVGPSAGGIFTDYSGMGNAGTFAKTNNAGFDLKNYLDNLPPPKEKAGPEKSKSEKWANGLGFASAGVGLATAGASLATGVKGMLGGSETKEIKQPDKLGDIKNGMSEKELNSFNKLATKNIAYTNQEIGKVKGSLNTLAAESTEAKANLLSANKAIVAIPGEIAKLKEPTKPTEPAANATPEEKALYESQKTQYETELREYNSKKSEFETNLETAKEAKATSEATLNRINPEITQLESTLIGLKSSLEADKGKQAQAMKQLANLGTPKK